MIEGRESAAKRGYGRAWQKARDGFLKKNSLCVICSKRGLVVAASVVDHITPHKGNKKLFWDRKNWQALCTNCHASYKQKLEKSGTVIGCGLDGVPIDPNHRWNRD